MGAPVAAIITQVTTADLLNEMARLHRRLNSMEAKFTELQLVLYDYQHTRQSAAAHQGRMAEAENEGQLVLQRYCRKTDVDKR